MQLKLVAVLAFLAGCQGSAYDAQYHVSVGAGHIVVANGIGQQVHIVTKQHVGSGGHYVQIHVTGPGVEVSSHQYASQPVSFESQHQPDILYQIFNQFEGQLDDAQYEKLLHVLEKHVEEGKIHPGVLYAVQILSPHHQNAELVSPFHQDIYGIVQKLFHHLGYDQGVSHKLGLWHGAEGISGRYGSQGHHYGAQDWTHESYGSHYPGSHDWAQKYYGSHYPGVYGSHDWVSQHYGSHYPGAYGSHSWGGQGYGSHYPGAYGYHSWAGKGYGSHYPGAYGSHDWARQSYGSHYPEAYGPHDWARQSHGGFYGPYASGSYDVGHGYGQHHFSLNKQWPYGGISAHWQGGYPDVHHQVLAN